VADAADRALTDDAAERALCAEAALCADRAVCADLAVPAELATGDTDDVADWAEPAVEPDRRVRSAVDSCRRSPAPSSASSKNATRPRGGSASPLRCWPARARVRATSGSRWRPVPSIPTTTMPTTIAARTKITSMANTVGSKTSLLAGLILHKDSR